MRGIPCQDVIYRPLHQQTEDVMNGDSITTTENQDTAKTFTMNFEEIISIGIELFNLFNC